MAANLSCKNHVLQHTERHVCHITGKSLSETHIFASINPHYDYRLFMKLPVQFMKTTSAEHVLAHVLLL